METSQYNIEIYQDLKGKKPFIEWIESLKDEALRAKIKIRLSRIRLGNLGDWKSLKKACMRSESMKVLVIGFILRRPLLRKLFCWEAARKPKKKILRKPGNTCKIIGVYHEQNDQIYGLLKRIIARFQ
jgi:putative component of toxin-antitoxin plasmid stabilization module